MMFEWLSRKFRRLQFSEQIRSPIITARFTDRARRVMDLADQEARRFNHEYIGTEHILLGLVREGSGVAANGLKNLDVDLREIRLELEKIVVLRSGMVMQGKLPVTPRARQVIVYALDESRNLNHNFVGTEHLLLGQLREQEGVAAQVLMNLGLNLEDVREEVLNLFDAGPQSRAATARGLGRWVRGSFVRPDSADSRKQGDSEDTSPE